MKLSDISVTRPVLASVISLLLIAFGLVSFNQLPLREYPDIDPPVVSIDTRYPGAAANVVETRITQIIEDRIAGVEGIKFISSSSSDGRSRISVEFGTNRDINDAANDIRDRVSGLLDVLPVEADLPEIEKTDSSDDVILWLTLTSSEMSVIELTDYAQRYLVDRLSVLSGVARVRIGGGLEYAMRIWLDRTQMAARGLTVEDIETALRSENVELPSGSIESIDRQFTARIERGYKTEDDFRKLVIKRAGNSDYLVRLGDVANIKKSAIEERTFFRGNGQPRIGIGIIKQSTGNTIDVAHAVIAEAEKIAATLPEGMDFQPAYDTSVFIRNAINEVYKTLLIAVILVVLVIYLFLGNPRAMLIPAVTIPVSLVASFIALLIMGFTVNLLTLLALVLAIGLVVDDAIVVLENISRRIEAGEPPLVAAFYGTRQVGFAVIATSVILIAVFVPIAFLQGDLGRLFSEFALTMASAVFFSTLVAVTLSAMLASKLLKHSEKNTLSAKVDMQFAKLRARYLSALQHCLNQPKWVLLVFGLLLLIAGILLKTIPSEYAPKEDRGAFFVLVNGPEGASYHYMEEYMNEIEQRLMKFVDNGEIKLLLVRTPRSFGSSIANFNNGIAIAVLAPWKDRRSAWTIMDDVKESLSDLTGVRAFPMMRQGFGRGVQKPVRFVIGGGTYEQLAKWRDIILEKVNENNPGFVGLDDDYKETKPQLGIHIDRDRAADLGVSVNAVGRTLESMLGGRRVTTFIENGEEYDVIIEGERDMQRTPTSMQNIYVRSGTTGDLIPLSNIIKISEFADANTLNRYNRIRAITLEANLADGYSLGEALDYLENMVKENMPEAVIDYKGQSLDLTSSTSSMLFVFILGLCVVFLVLAAQFESYVHPFVIMLTVPLAISGALMGLFLFNGTLNIYTEVGLIMLVGLAAKNGILIVEFINQLRDRGMEFDQAIVEAAAIRLRPIIMTGITTAAGSLPLVLSSGAGAETRGAIGVVILCGTIAATAFTVIIVPVAYSLFARKTGSLGDVKRALEKQEAAFKLEEVDNDV